MPFLLHKKLLPGLIWIMITLLWPRLCFLLPESTIYLIQCISSNYRNHKMYIKRFCQEFGHSSFSFASGIENYAAFTKFVKQHSSVPFHISCFMRFFAHHQKYFFKPKYFFKKCFFPKMLLSGIVLTIKCQKPGVLVFPKKNPEIYHNVPNSFFNCDNYWRLRLTARLYFGLNHKA